MLLELGVCAVMAVGRRQAGNGMGEPEQVWWLLAAPFFVERCPVEGNTIPV